MTDKIRNDIGSVIGGYLTQEYSDGEQQIIQNEIHKIAGCMIELKGRKEICSYEEVQEMLSCLNEKEIIRKRKGVYYTPNDIVRFILTNSVKLACGTLAPNNLHETDVSNVMDETLCYEKTIYDPTCGSGVFLLAALEMKLDLLESCDTDITKEKIQKVVSTIMGNDLNRDSIVITKVRLFLCIVHRYGAERAKGLAEILKHCFASYDFVITEPNRQKKYDIIVGNPPYVEDLKSENVPEKRYGNIYANVLENAALHLKQGGVLGFVIPLSYVATPRMKKIRDELYQYVPEQYILSYADRPDCLFTSVHQKLCVFWGKHSEKERNIYTGNYQYWYREERQNLFKSPAIVKNDFVAENYIPKLGTKTDVNIYQKIVSADRPMLELLETGENGIYLNTRATFWMKAFLKEHAGSEYKKFRCCNQEYANLCMCLLNSSLFWWYWITVSDCWHITRKELLGFMVPRTDIFAETDRLATALEERLEETKVYVGTKQTEYEYRHRACIKEIHQIDDYINALYGLTEEEGLYIKNFAYRYRVSGGADSECN